MLPSGKGPNSSGLLMDSVIMTDNLATAHESEIERVIGELADMNELDAALRVTLGLEGK